MILRQNRLVPLSNNLLEGLPLTNQKSVGGVPLSARSGNGDAPNLENKAEGKMNDYNENGSSKKDLRVSVATSSNFNDPQSSSTSKLATDETG
ncbi:hypothetical protein CJ030_MR1G013831 [Morella rubra]|jgi:hypothetical protein|uniref:Uncharacterized protein n=1 Tax=Morella rubra TaxID=262757 RepID=A0A6A1WRM9_9ROSI|nr:hypothetical protein CJ030_MR1G013831 [Morella rubra]